LIMSMVPLCSMGTPAPPQFSAAMLPAGWASWVSFGLILGVLQGYLAHKKTPTPLGPPEDPRHRLTVVFYGGTFTCK